jgi:Na+/H+-dicarboxylate symporter
MIQMGVDVLLGMAIYVATVAVELFILLLLYLIIVLIVCNRSPLQFLKHIREVLLLAFSTSSSAAVMPLSIKTAEDILKVRSSTAQFLIPLGSTINMNGTALYQGTATIFLAQVYDVNLSMSAMPLIVVTTVGASIGSPGTPGVGIVILAMVLSSVGIPAVGALILGVDRIIDMCRTAVNVAGDLTACTVIDEWS